MTNDLDDSGRRKRITKPIDTNDSASSLDADERQPFSSEQTPQQQTPKQEEFHSQRQDPDQPQTGYDTQQPQSSDRRNDDQRSDSRRGRSFDSPRAPYDDRRSSGPRQPYSDRPRYDDRPPRYDDRPPRDNDRQPRYSDRQPRYDDRPPRFNDRPQRFDDRPPRFNDRPPRYDDRPPRYDDRPPRFNDRPPRYDDRPPRFNDRPPRFNDRSPRYDDRPPRQDRQPYDNRQRFDPQQPIDNRAPYDRRGPLDDRPRRDDRQGFRSRSYDNRGYDRDRPRDNRGGERGYNRGYQRNVSNDGDLDRRRTPPQRPTNIAKALVRLLFASRGFSLKAIQEGRVTLNGAPVKNPNSSVRILTDQVTVDGVLLAHNPSGVYVVMNKPKKFAGAREQNSRHIMNLISKKFGWYIPCGPLAKSASGIVILTNDPDQSDIDRNVFSLMDKEYWFKVNAAPAKRELNKVATKIAALYDENADHVKVEVAQKNTRNSWVSITVRRARMEELTKLLSEAGMEILAIERRRIGSISVEDLPAGSWRRMSVEEVQTVITSSVSLESVEEKVEEQSVELSEGPNVWQKLYQRWFKST